MATGIYNAYLAYGLHSPLDQQYRGWSTFSYRLLLIHELPRYIFSWQVTTNNRAHRLTSFLRITWKYMYLLTFLITVIIPLNLQYYETLHFHVCTHTSINTYMRIPHGNIQFILTIKHLYVVCLYLTVEGQWLKTHWVIPSSSVRLKCPQTNCFTGSSGMNFLLLHLLIKTHKSIAMNSTFRSVCCI